MELDIKKIIKELSLEEKVSLLSGANFWNTSTIDRLGIPSVLLTDGPHGVRKQGGKADHLGLNKSIPSTCFPTAATIANSWDKDLIHEMGVLLGNEASHLDVNVLLGPGLNIKRNPLCGRNFEYFSEDPYLSGKLAGKLIAGIQDNGISACPKHFAVNSQEHLRMSIDEIVDERALQEIYLEGFRIAIKEGKPKTIMTSYNKINGTYSNENTHILQDILFNDWGYDGLVVTDWGGNNDRVNGLIAGNHLEMPSTGGLTNKEVLEAVKSGRIKEELVDERIEVLLSLINDTKLNKHKATEFREEDHHQAAVRIASNSIVLLKNNREILPLDEHKRIGIIGDFAKHPRYQGAGSSLIKPTKITSFLEAAQESSLNIVGYEKGFKRFGGISSILIHRAVNLAKKCDVILLFFGLDEGSEAEGLDRENMELRSNQIELLKEIKKINPSLVVVLSGGSPVEIPFVNDVDAIVHGYLGGQGSGEAILNVLTGKINPSGKLGESYPYQLNDILSSKYYPGIELTSEHREGIYVGYRYLDKANKDVLFPFGFGLSYTTFEYSDLVVLPDCVKCKITNKGQRAGYEIVQLYISQVDAKIFRPEKELKGFEKIYLESGESKEITIFFEEHTFAYFHVQLNKWVVDKGQYQILIGASSRDIRLSTTIEYGDISYQNPYDDNLIQDYIKLSSEISKESFEHLLGRKTVYEKWDRNIELTMNDVMAQIQYQNWKGRLLYHLILLIRKVFIAIRKPIIGNNLYFIINMPFRQLPRYTKGKIKEKSVIKWLKRLRKRRYK